MTNDLSGLFEGPIPGRRTMHEYVYSTLRMAILDGKLTGGTRLVQADIASTMGVSTTPVREALRDLAAEGLIKLDPHRGGIVHELVFGELEEILRLRTILEPEAIRQAWPNVTDELIDEIESVHHKIGTASSTSEFVQLNDRFHRLLFEKAAAPRLLGILETLTAPWVMYVSAALNQDDQHRERAAQGHSEILEALRNRDVDGVIEASIEHLSITHRTLEAALDLVENAPPS
ncbi:MAG: GntR family transcriptional regulator [Acidimicrobiia bacterium]|nr:GntR family transcriptional regulator [Acidimicrobiia bacterium]